MAETTAITRVSIWFVHLAILIMIPPYIARTRAQRPCRGYGDFAASSSIDGIERCGSARELATQLPDCSPDRATGLWRVLSVRTRLWWSRGRFLRDVGGKETGRRPDNRRGQGDVAGGGRRPSAARRPRSVVANVCFHRKSGREILNLSISSRDPDRTLPGAGDCMAGLIQPSRAPRRKPTLLLKARTGRSGRAILHR